jgi:hypothetical protein
MYRLRLICPLLGEDETGPLHPTLERAREVAIYLIDLYRGRLKVEIRRVVNLRLKKSELVETIEAFEYAATE